jgi:hypothetical protein
VVTRPPARQDRAQDVLARLLAEAVVSVSDGVSAGSGCFVAPGLLLTCAHVVPGGKGTAVTVEWGGRHYPATVRYASPAPHRSQRLWPFPDLAVVELVDGPPDHPCVWLDARRPLLRTRLYLTGHAQQYRDGPARNSAVVSYHGPYGPDGSAFLQVAHDEIPPGMSGGPALNLSSGGVCGVTKTERSPGTPAGGLLASVRGLRTIDPTLYRELWRAHDCYHAADTSWGRAVDELLPAIEGELRPRDERSLRGLLATLPPADDHAGRLLQAVGPLCPAPSEPLLDYGDVVADLGEMVPPRGLPHVMAYAADLSLACEGPTSQALRDWVLIRAGRLDLDEPALERLAGSAPPAEPPALMVRLQPAGTDALRYHVAIWRFLDAGNITSVVTADDALTVEDVLRQLNTVIPAELALIPHGTRPIVEFIVPVELMDLELDEMRIWPEARWSTLGRRYPVVVRDITRVGDDVTRSAVERRWSRSADIQAARGLTFIPCADPRNHEQIEGWLEADPQLAAFVFAHSPVAATHAAFEVALPAGVPVMLWRRTRRQDCESCPDCDGGDRRTDPAAVRCCGQEFFSELVDSLVTVTVADLPERVRVLRNEATTADGSRSGQAIVLLWDNPRRRPPPIDRLVLPEEARR